MSTATLGNLTLTDQWRDVVVTYAGAASVNVLVQNVGSERVEVVHGGASAPSGTNGTVLDPLDSVQVNAAHIWARCEDGAGVLSVTTV